MGGGGGECEAGLQPVLTYKSVGLACSLLTILQACYFPLARVFCGGLGAVGVFGHVIHLTLMARVRHLTSIEIVEI